MRLANFTDYSLRVLIYLGADEKELTTVSEISTKFEISNNHLVKVVHNLSKIGLIESFKGKGGGIRLACEAHKINIGKIVKKLEQDSPLLECFGPSPQCKLNPSCKLKMALNTAQNEFYKVLNQFTLADILSNTSYIKKGLNL